MLKYRCTIVYNCIYTTDLKEADTYTRMLYRIYTCHDINAISMYNNLIYTASTSADASVTYYGVRRSGARSRTKQAWT